MTRLLLAPQRYANFTAPALRTPTAITRLSVCIIALHIPNALQRAYMLSYHRKTNDFLFLLTCSGILLSCTPSPPFYSLSIFFLHFLGFFFFFSEKPSSFPLSPLMLFLNLTHENNCDSWSSFGNLKNKTTFACLIFASGRKKASKKNLICYLVY